MSEYKFACPVCGQHMQCDSSQAGTVMECPTCFQKITAPQAPAAGNDQKFVLTGTKVAEKPRTTNPADKSGTTPAAGGFPWVVLIVVLAIGLAGAGVYALREKLFHLGSAAWQPGDVGYVGAVGSFDLSNGVFTVRGSGADIWRRADGFYSLFQPLNGDGSLTARVLNVKDTDVWAKGGVMIRESRSADSIFALATIRPDGQAQFVWRSATGAEAGSSQLAGGTGSPKWVKIVRNGDKFSAFYKVNARDAWQQVGTAQTINMPPDTQIGMIVCAHKAETLCEAQFDQLDLQTVAKTVATSGSPKPVLPPASDTNWTLNLDPMKTPAAAAVGRIHGQSSTLDRVIFQNGLLTFRPSVKGSPDVSLAINFGGALPEAVAGKTINVTADADKAARVTMHWKEGAQNEKENFAKGYVLRLEMGGQTGNRMPGKIYFCAPDAMKSYALGTFNAEIRKPKAKK